MAADRWRSFNHTAIIYTIDVRPSSSAILNRYGRFRISTNEFEILKILLDRGLLGVIGLILIGKAKERLEEFKTGQVYVAEHSRQRLDVARDLIGRCTAAAAQANELVFTVEREPQPTQEEVRAALKPVKAAEYALAQTFSQAKLFFEPEILYPMASAMNAIGQLAIAVTERDHARAEKWAADVDRYANETIANLKNEIAHRPQGKHRWWHRKRGTATPGAEK